jgi:XRE family aerobic/anaerobic benzoate catabolism transcriptional regulator
MFPSWRIADSGSKLHVLASHPLLNALAETVRDLRRAHGWTRRELRDKTGISERFLADIEAARANPSVLRLVALAQALGTSVDGLLSRAARPLDRSVAKKVIALLGLRGAGKSSVGPALARRLQLPFVELDARIEERAGQALTDLFQVHGESLYRRLEHEALRALLDTDTACVLATGGGIVTAPETFALLRQHAFTVWLRARPEDHWARVLAQGDTRPMADDDRAFHNLCAILAEREPLYRQADVVIDTAGRDVDAIAGDLALRFA